ncbi:GntR family transcriptional regulator [Oribacterium sp. WCC10]|uniref:GntR family transcriptional regulator n=1 Tax=Oribacterium sp. WCC10 TaxID=1855343 RepID=UPI0008F1D986|nr:GntR family transcriptional regulator [Oribacterium sp. WCC10]SFG30238.1 DNA-binding transcriptional regulator, GntR family [Oribacterium sp. WCC10]
MDKLSTNKSDTRNDSIEAPKLPDEIHYYLWNKIATLELKPGVKLSELGLAEQFKCSRIPVREAVRRLNVEGALDSQPQRGSFVSKINFEEVRKVRYLREVLETRVVLDAYDAGLLTPLIPLLRGMVRDQKNLISFNELEKLTELDTQFHDFFYHLQNKEFVQSHTGRHDIHYIRARRFALGIERSDKQRYDDSINIVLQHERMIDAIEKKDRTALSDELILHFRNINHTLENIVNNEEFSEYFE